MAHHKPGHNPPGHQQQKQRFRFDELPFSIRLPEAERTFSVAEDKDGLKEWSFYQDPDYGFTIEVPTGIMKQSPHAPRGSRFNEIGGGSGLLDVYGGANLALLDPEEIAAELEQNPQIGKGDL